MNFQCKSFLIIFSILLSAFVLVNSADNELKELKELKDELDNEKIKRHIEIRKELEKEATPFLEHAPDLFNLNFLQFKFPVSANIKDEKITWAEYFSNYSFVDIVMGMFSIIALGGGTVYIAWRFNPLADKIAK